MKSFIAGGTKGEGVGGEGGPLPTSPHAGGHTTGPPQPAARRGGGVSLRWSTRAVNRGAAYLDVHAPGWPARILVDFIDVGHPLLSPLAMTFRMPVRDTLPGTLWSPQELRMHAFVSKRDLERRIFNMMWAWLVVNR